MKKSFRPLLILLAIGGGLNTAEAQPLPIRVGYTALNRPHLLTISRCARTVSATFRFSMK